MVTLLYMWGSFIELDLLKRSMVDAHTWYVIQVSNPATELFPPLLPLFGMVYSKGKGSAYAFKGLPFIMPEIEMCEGKKLKHFFTHCNLFQLYSFMLKTMLCFSFFFIVFCLL